MPTGLGSYEQMARHIVTRTSKRARRKKRGDFRWRTDAWEVISQALFEESDACQDAGPCAVITYTDLVDLALKYLKAHPNAGRLNTLLDLVETDVKVLGATFYAMQNSDYTPRVLGGGDERLISIALQQLNSYILLMQRQMMEAS